MGTELWTINGAAAFFTKEQDAVDMANWLNSDPRGNRVTRNGKGYYQAHKIYTDCYIGKIRKGYDTFQVRMLRDGTHTVKKTPRFAPTKYGYKNRSFGTAIKENHYEKELVLLTLAENEADAVRLAEKERVKTLLDDIWKFPDGTYHMPLNSIHRSYFEKI